MLTSPWDAKFPGLVIMADNVRREIGKLISRY